MKLKRAARLFYMTKGLIPDWLDSADDQMLDEIIDSYTKRLWGQEEAYLREEGFIIAWENYIK